MESPEEKKRIKIPAGVMQNLTEERGKNIKIEQEFQEARARLEDSNRSFNALVSTIKELKGVKEDEKINFDAEKNEMIIFK